MSDCATKPNIKWTPKLTEEQKLELKKLNKLTTKQLSKKTPNKVVSKIEKYHSRLLKSERAENVVIILDEMKANQVAPNITTYNTAMEACTKARWPEKALGSGSMIEFFEE